MASRPSSSTDPWHWRLIVDDVGEFDLWVMPPDCVLPQGPCQGLRFGWELHLQSGPCWSLRSGQASAPELRLPGGHRGSREREEEIHEIDLSAPTEFWMGPRRVHSRRPAEGSAAMQWTFEGGLPGVAEGGCLFLPYGHSLSFGPRQSAWPVEDWKESITLAATSDGLTLACAQGVRMGLEDGDFDEAQPLREVPLDGAAHRPFWCVARPGPPVFVTLERQFEAPSAR